MAHTLYALIPLLACPLGMALMAGVPALLHRSKRRRRAPDLTAMPNNGAGAEPTRQAA
jgi:hypothetical protein